MRINRFIALLTTVTLGFASSSGAAPSREEIVAETMRHYDGPSATEPIADSLVGTVMCGYQGWFSCEGDAANLGWNHYQIRGGFEPGRCSIDLWPDMSEYGDDEKFVTPFKHADGSAATLFSSVNKKSVARHFQWMRDYGIDGAYCQRFASSVKGDEQFRRVNMVLDNCREGANRASRAYAVMYDLSGTKTKHLNHIMDDWRLLVDEMGITRDAKDRAYMRHRGKPVVAVWGVGFKDRDYTMPECKRLIDFLKNDPKYGGNTVMLGVPTGWRNLERDSIKEPMLHEIIELADVVSPWTVGRYRKPEEVARHASTFWGPDVKWCNARGKDYLPVVFPGFSWYNLKHPDNPKAKLGQIPRLKGEFLWRQYVEATGAGATMVYQAMFDEVDEGTAVFKCTNDPPVGESPFLDYEGLPSDHYLWLVGQGGKLVRGEIKPTETQPKR